MKESLLLFLPQVGYLSGTLIAFGCLCVYVMGVWAMKAISYLTKPYTAGRHVQCTPHFYPLFFRGGFFQTLCNVIRPKKLGRAESVFEMELLPTIEGAKVGLNWFEAQPPPSETFKGPTFVLMHGLSGGTDSPYITSLIHTIKHHPAFARVQVQHVAKPSKRGVHVQVQQGGNVEKNLPGSTSKKEEKESNENENARGARSVQATTVGPDLNDWVLTVFHARGCGGTPLFSPTPFHAGKIDDLKCIARHLKKERPNSPIICIGFSLGGSVLANYLGQMGNDSLVSMGICVSAPWDLKLCDQSMSKRLNEAVFSAALRVGLVEYALKHEKMFKKNDIYSNPKVWEALLAARTVREFDALSVVKIFGFESVDDYYEKATSRQWLEDIQRPVLVVHAANDPVSPWYPTPATVTNPNFSYAVSRDGGHVGWYGWGSVNWCDATIVSYLEHALPALM